MNNISVIIITYNEEENIRECLEGVKWADEIIIVDSFSTDKTLQICKDYTDRIFQRKWEGFGFQKQFALEQTTLDWVLSIDADERVSGELEEEILSNKNTLDKDGYCMPFKFYWLGKQLRFGGCGKERHIRLFRREKAKFQGLIHEKLLIDGEIGYLKNPIIHVSYKNIENYFNKFNLYSTMIANQRFKEGRKIPFVFQIFASICDFFNRYIFKLGFLDGMPGFLWASFSSFHRLVKYAKLWEMQKEQKER
jgi:glycosyltransferase involved in cell wall biosynthesis